MLIVRPRAKANLDDIYFDFDTKSRTAGLSPLRYAGFVDRDSAAVFIAIALDLAHAKNTLTLGDVVPSDSRARDGCAGKGLWKTP